ncbi:MAG: hypothetical protein KGH56_00370 [Patescibacteria group bacterium]|nr:hypothetical protein [Patescibacteria group bacterium]
MGTLETILSSKKVRLAAGVVGALILALLIFHAGVVVGAHRGSSFRRDADGGFRHPFFPGGFMLPHGFIPNAHGAVGTVSAVSLPTFTIETRYGTSQTILVGTSTILRAAGDASATRISTGDNVIVLGEPDGQGRITATFIRIFSSAQKP